MKKVRTSSLYGRTDNQSQEVKHCAICGCLLPKYHTGAKICECCADDIDEDNPHRQYERGIET